MVVPPTPCSIQHNNDRTALDRRKANFHRQDMTGSSDLRAIKAQMRAKLRFRRRHFSANLDAMAALAAFRSLPEALDDLFRRGTPIVSGYASVGGEPDILPLLTSYVDADHIALPFHAQRDEHLSFRLWRPDQPLEHGPWRTPQPLAQNSPATPDIILCPLLGFDRYGGRLGQGGGHYDRYFSKHPNALRIGIAWSVQEVDHAPLEPTDMALDAILTEQEMIFYGKRLHEA